MPEELKPATTVLIATDGNKELAFARIICSYDSGTYAVELPNGRLVRREIPDAEAILPYWMAMPPEIRSFISKAFRTDLAVMRNLGKLTPDQRECLAVEEMRLNEIERMTPNFGTSEAAETRH
jgi:hypothetical protein